MLTIRVHTMRSLTRLLSPCWGKYVSYKNKPAFTPYSASCSGKTTSQKATWGGTQYPYLSGGVSSIETVNTKTVTITRKNSGAT